MNCARYRSLSGKLLFGGVPPLSPSHYLVRVSPHMNRARYRSLSGKLLFGGMPMPSPLGKVPPKGADEVCNFAKQNCIAVGNQ